MKRMLIVEDEYIIAEDLKLILRKFGYPDVSVARSANKAAEIIEHEKIDLALIDIKLEDGMSGLELSEKAQKEYNIPFIFISAFSEKEIVDRAMKTNPVAYLLKPIQDNELENYIKDVFGEKKTNLFES